MYLGYEILVVHRYRENMSVISVTGNHLIKITLIKQLKMCSDFSPNRKMRFLVGFEEILR